MTCEKSYLRTQKQHWKIAYVSNLSLAEKLNRMESIEDAVESKDYAILTKTKWKKDLLTWKIAYDNTGKI